MEHKKQWALEEKMALENDVSGAFPIIGDCLPERKIAASVSVSIFLAFGLCVAACTQNVPPSVEKQKDISIGILEYPEGAVAPKGVLLIKEGMSHKEVLDILAPLYEYTPFVTDSELELPSGYTFKYLNEGKIKRIEVVFNNHRVVFVAYGYTESRAVMY